MSDLKQHGGEKRDHKDQGLGQEFGDLQKMENKDDQSPQDLPQMREGRKGVTGDNQCKSGQKCGDKDEKKKMYGEGGCGNQGQCH